MTALVKWFGSLLEDDTLVTKRSYISFEPLDKREIRVLTIDAESSDSETISCTIENVSLDDPDLGFVALSWVWGPLPSKFKDIVVNGEILSIPPALHAILLCFKRMMPFQPMWIDAICIDQQDADEEAVQIPLMADIYTCCANAWVWMGKPTFYSEIVLNDVVKKKKPLKESMKVELVFKIF